MIPLKRESINSYASGGWRTLLAVGMILAVWVPPAYVRELRALINHRQRLISQQTRSKNRLRSLLQRQHIVPPGGALLYH